MNIIVGDDQDKNFLLNDIDTNGAGRAQKLKMHEICFFLHFSQNLLQHTHRAAAPDR